MKKVRDILIEHKQGYYKPGKFESGNVHLVRISDITDEAFVDEDSTPMVKVDQDVLSNFGVQKNDFLFARTGGAGRFALVRNDFRGIFASYLIRFRFQSEFDPRFLRYYFLSDKFQIELKSTIHGGVNQNIHAENIKDCSVPVFPLPEQQRIVSLLDETFAGLAQVHANAERNLVNAREVFEVVLEDLFNNDIWKENRLDEVCEVKDGTHDTPKYVDDGIPFVTQKNIREEGLSFDDTKFIDLSDHEKFYKRSNVSFGDILISMIGANRGMACIVDDKRVFSIKNVGLIKSSENVNQSYLLYFLKSPRAKKYISENSKGGAQEFIGLTELRKFPILIPPLEEQRAIVKRLDALAAETSRLEAVYQSKLEAVEELKKSVLAKAFEGEL